MSRVVHDSAGLKIVAAHWGAVWSLRFFRAPSGQLLLASIGVGPGEEYIRLWEVATGQLLRVYPAPLGNVNALAVAGPVDGRMVLAGGTDIGFVRWNALTGEMLDGPDYDDVTAWDVATVMPPDAPAMFIGGDEYVMYRWDAATGEQIGEPWVGHKGSVLALSVFTLPDGTLVIASGSDDGTVRRWDAVTGAPIGDPLTGLGLVVNQVASVTAEGRTVLACAEISFNPDIKAMHRWDAVTGESLGPPIHASSRFMNLTAARIRGAQRLISSNDDETIRMWDAVTGELLDESLLSGVSVAATTATDGSTVIATGAEDGSISINTI